MTELHDVLIAVHATTATVAFVAGWLLLRPSRPGGTAVLRAWLGCLVVMAVTLVAAVAVDWATFSTVERLVFSPLLILAAVMVRQAVRVTAVWRPAAPVELRRAYERAGFTLISLFVGFAVIAVLRAGGPPWAGVGAGVLGVLLGRAFVHAAARRALERTASSVPSG